MTTPHNATAQLTLDDLRQRPTITVDEAAQVLHLNRAGAYGAVKRGEIPSIRVGRRIVVPSAALLRMLDAAAV